MLKIIQIILIFFCFVNIQIIFAEEFKAGKKIATRICQTCHGMDGIATGAGNSVLSPNITAQQKDYLIAKLRSYKNNTISHPQMSVIASMLSDEDIENVAHWYSSIKIEITLPE